MDTGEHGNSQLALRWSLARIVDAFLFISCRARSRPAGIAASDEPVRILLTGTYYSQNWIDSQLGPIANARGVAEITFVGAKPLSPQARVKFVEPPKFLRLLFGEVLSRLLWFVRVGFRERPEVVGGFHLLLNGLVALALGALIRARTLYICVGGITEVRGGGFGTDNKLFRRLRHPDSRLETKLVEAVGRFDFVVVRGTEAQAYFAAAHPLGNIQIISAGVDSSVFAPGSVAKDVDLILVARLSAVKRIELYLQIVKALRDGIRPGVTALVVGDGPDMKVARDFIARHDLGVNVELVGHSDKVSALLQRAKVFVLTSKSEGLSQAMIQAMLCGVPPVVPDVGSLGDLVKDGWNGYLVRNHSDVTEFVPRIESLLESDTMRDEFGNNARQDAMSCSQSVVAKKWEMLFSSLQRHGS